MTTMVSPHATEPATASGLTPAQTAAIASLVHEATAAAADTLRHELARWHCYLALYLLGQIGLALLAILLLQALRDPPPIRNAASGLNVPVAHRAATAIQGKRRVNRPQFEMYRGETASDPQNSLLAVSQGWARSTGVQVIGLAAIRGPFSPTAQGEQAHAFERWL